MNNHRILGIVPARSGSRGILEKNIRHLGGKPLMAWSIESALESGVLDKVILLTDSEAYASVGKKYGALVPFLEPQELASDNAHVFKALKWLLEELVKSGYRPDYIMLLEPTAPGRQPRHIKELAKLVIESGAEAGFTAMPVDPHYSAHWQFSLSEEKSPELVNGTPFNEIVRQRSNLPPLYVRGGSTYMSTIECLLKENPDMYGEQIKVLVIDPKYAIDLDTEEDWIRSSKRLEELKGNEE